MDAEYITDIGNSYEVATEFTAEEEKIPASTGSVELEVNGVSLPMVK